MATKRFGAAARAWGPVGTCASILCAVLVWLGITGCGLAYPAAGIALMGAAGGGGSSGDPIVVPTQYAVTTGGLVGLTLVFEGPEGGDLESACIAEPQVAFAGENVIAAMQIVYGPGRDDFQWLAITRAPYPEQTPALKRALADGTEIDSIELPFPGSFDVDTDTWTVYIAVDSGADVAAVDLAAGTVRLLERSAGVQVQSAGDLRVINGATWIADNANGSIVISGQVEEIPGERIILEPGSQVSIDHAPGSGLIHAVTNGGLWEIDVATRHPTRLFDLDGGMTISADEADNAGFTARATDGSFAAYLRQAGEVDPVETRRFEPGLVPLDQVTVDGHTFVALRDVASGLASRIACPAAEEVGVFNVWGLSIAKQSNTPPPPPPDDEELPEVTIDDAVVDESAGTVSVAVHLSRPSMNVVGVDYTVGTGDGTARPFDDFVPASGTLLFDGVTTRTITLTVVNDDLNEIDEHFSVDLSNPAGVTITDGHADVTIVDDDPVEPGLPFISIHDSAFNEADAAWFFNLDLSEPADHDVSVDVTFVAGTATADDVDLITATVMLPAGDTTTQFVFQPRNDALYEPDEEFVAVLSHPMGAVIADGQAVGTITSDDQQPRIAPIAGQVLVEGTATAPVLVPVTLDAFSGVDTTVTFAAVNGTAIEGVHFIVQTPSVVIPAGAIGGNLVLDIIGDTSDNPDRSFALMVGAINATVMSSVVNVTIADDDAVIPPGTIQVTVGTAPVDLAITVDGVTSTAPPPFFWEPNSTHELRARATFNLADRRYRFSQWSDGDTNATRTVVAVAPTQYVALYTTEYRLTVITSAGGTITISPLSESGYYLPGEFVTVTAVPAPNFTAQFDGFDDLGGPNEAFVTMNSPRTVTVTFLQGPPAGPPPSP